MSYISVDCSEVRGINHKREIIELDERFVRMIKKNIEIMHAEEYTSITDELYFYCEPKFNGSEIIYKAKSCEEYDAAKSNIFTMGPDRIMEILINIKHIGAGRVLTPRVDDELLPIYEITIRHFETLIPDCTFCFTPSKNFIIFIGTLKIDNSQFIDVPLEII